MSRVIYEIKGERTGLHEVYHPRGKLPLVADIFLSKKASPHTPQDGTLIEMG